MHHEGYTHARARENASDTAAPLRLNDAARAWARLTGTSRPHRSTLLRWCTRGCRGVRLRGERAGNEWTVSVDALREFRERLNVPTSPTVTAGPARAAEIAVALDELDRMVGEKPTAR